MSAQRAGGNLQSEAVVSYELHYRSSLSFGERTQAEFSSKIVKKPGQSHHYRHQLSTLVHFGHPQMSFQHFARAKDVLQRAQRMG